MALQAAGKTDVGQNREINEDYFYIDNTTGLFIVCGGLGGQAAGEIASHKAVEFSRDDEVFQLTTDHTLLNDIKTEFKDIDENQINKFAHCLTRSVGSNESVAVETLMFAARENDVLLLCTDGLSNYFRDQNAVADMLAGNSVHRIADTLVEFANESGGSDNITAVVIRVVDVADFKLNTRRVKLSFDNKNKPAALPGRS